MPDASAIVTFLAIALLLMIMLSFAFGTQWNIRKGNARLRWLQPALPVLGERTTLRWLGSSVVQLDLVEPRDPFREVTVMVVLEPRDVPLLWLFARAGGRRDMLILRASLRRAPRLEVEAVAAGAWIKASDDEEVATWPAISFPNDIRATAVPGSDPASVAAVRRAWERLATASGGVWRLSIRRTVPHLEVHLRPSSDPGAPPMKVVDTIRDLAVELSRA
ncbi:MAG: hypothetical protein E6I65_03475 [Chloroflexi bacterium]|nr:MAG: hypothetical protein E6I65_03475 [Chloroflexota bacterium]